MPEGVSCCGTSAPQVVALEESPVLRELFEELPVAVAGSIEGNGADSHISPP